MSVFHIEEMVTITYKYLFNIDSHWFTSNYVFTLGGAIVSWRSMKQSCITNSTMEIECVATS